MTLTTTPPIVETAYTEKESGWMDGGCRRPARVPRYFLFSFLASSENYDQGNCSSDFFFIIIISLSLSFSVVTHATVEGLPPSLIARQANHFHRYLFLVTAVSRSALAAKGVSFFLFTIADSLDRRDENNYYSKW